MRPRVADLLVQGAPCKAPCPGVSTHQGRPSKDNRNRSGLHFLLPKCTFGPLWAVTVVARRPAHVFPPRAPCRAPRSQTVSFPSQAQDLHQRQPSSLSTIHPSKPSNPWNQSKTISPPIGNLTKNKVPPIVLRVIFKGSWFIC